MHAAVLPGTGRRRADGTGAAQGTPPLEDSPPRQSNRRIPGPRSGGGYPAGDGLITCTRLGMRRQQRICQIQRDPQLTAREQFRQPTPQVKSQLVQVSHGSEIKPRRGHPEPAQMLVEHEQRSQNNSSERSCPTADNPPPVSSKIDTNAPLAAAHAHLSARAVLPPNTYQNGRCARYPVSSAFRIGQQHTPTIMACPSWNVTRAIGARHKLATSSCSRQSVAGRGMPSLADPSRPGPPDIARSCCRHAAPKIKSLTVFRRSGL
jgi:hypothetical protein